MGERKELLDHSQEPDKLEPAFDANAFFGKSEEQNVEALFAEPHQEEKKAPSSNARFWNVEYYSFLFDVDTKDVTIRLLRSLLPYPPKFFDIIKPNPDLAMCNQVNSYGPFWIATTLTFIMSATGNVAQYFNSLNDESTEEWAYNPDKLTYGAIAIYGYLFLIPLILWGICKYYKVPLKWIEILCVYGYSLFIYVPAAILCIIPLLTWIMVGVAGVISTSFLLTNFFVFLKEADHIKKGLIILLGMGLLHVGFALTCKFYFFA